MEANHEFKVHGGENFKAIPCLNDSDDWCKTVSNWISNWSNASSTVKVDSEKINA
jgi:ferrochelatase